MTGGEFFLAASQVTASLGGREQTCLLLAPPDQGAPAQRRLEPARHSPMLGLVFQGASKKRAAGRILDRALQISALKRKEREAPQDSPRARKKVMRAPATSLSCGNTCLGARHMVRDTR